jgi:hypothetical protein
MAYPQAFLDWEEVTEQRGQRSHALSLIRRQRRRVGELPNAIDVEIENLSLVELDQLGEDLLEFTGLENLRQ